MLGVIIWSTWSRHSEKYYLILKRIFCSVSLLTAIMSVNIVIIGTVLIFECILCARKEFCALTLIPWKYTSLLFSTIVTYVMYSSGFINFVFIIIHKFCYIQTPLILI
jgi:hypothetical protein